jgi:hypothetical protein
MDLVHDMAQQRGTHPAGRTEAAALVRKEMREIAPTSKRSRDSSNTMKAPAVGRSSKPMRRSNSVASMQIPEGPLICTAWVRSAPQSSSTSRTVTPNGYS